MGAMSDLDVHYSDHWNDLFHVSVLPAYPC